MTEASLVPGRSCEGCTLCCKVLRVTELESPQGEYCRHCAVGTGCQIWVVREPVCRNFHCGYLTTPEIGEHWRPAVSNMVVVSELGGERISINVDEDRPDVWREPQYHADLRRWAQLCASALIGIVVCVGKNATVILPDRDVDLGLVADDEQIVLSRTSGPAGTWLDALKLKNSDPRLVGSLPGVSHNLTF